MDNIHHDHLIMKVLRDNQALLDQEGIVADEFFFSDLAERMEMLADRQGLDEETGESLGRALARIKRRTVGATEDTVTITGKALLAG